jgi:hypothetical protein
MHKRRHYRRAAGVVVAAACLLAPVATASAASPLRGWWPMNERSGQKINDWSGNGNHGMLGSTAGVDDNDPTWIKGIFNYGSALHFGGDDFVTIPDSPSLRPQKMTVSAWFRGDMSPGNSRYLVAKGADGCIASSYALYTGDNGGIGFYVYNGTDWVRSPLADPSVWDNQWHNAAGTYDGNRVRLYIDGREIGTGTPTNITVNYDLPSVSAALGVYDGSCSIYLVGDIDGVSIWDRALPVADIAAVFRSLIGGR